MITKQLVQQLAQERMDELNRGLFIVEISITPSFIINLEIDKIEGYVAIEDCVSVSRNVEHNLDREDQDFELHVSSAGLNYKTEQKKRVNFLKLAMNKFT